MSPQTVAARQPSTCSMTCIFGASSRTKWRLQPLTRPSLNYGLLLLLYPMPLSILLRRLKDFEASRLRHSAANIFCSKHFRTHGLSRRSCKKPKQTVVGKSNTICTHSDLRAGRYLSSSRHVRRTNEMLLIYAMASRLHKDILPRLVKHEATSKQVSFLQVAIGVAFENPS